MTPSAPAAGLPTLPAAGWDAVAAALGPGVVLVLGTPGAGKSRLARYLALVLAARGRRTALLSGDVGQATVGPPACLAVSLEPPFEKPALSWFVGDVAPTGLLLPLVAGTARLAAAARARGAEVVILDPTGLAEGTVAHLLKYHKAAAAGVNQVVAVARARELDPLLAVLAGLSLKIHRLAPSPHARDRGPGERRLYRQERFRQALAGARPIRVPAERVLAADWGPGTGVPPPLPGTLAGLLDGAGFCLGLGLVAEAAADGLVIATAFPDAEAIHRVQLGRARLDAEGQEVARPRPGPLQCPPPPAAPDSHASPQGPRTP